MLPLWALKAGNSLENVLIYFSILGKTNLSCVSFLSSLKIFLEFQIQYPLNIYFVFLK
jgi:hypothetical protein